MFILMLCAAHFKVKLDQNQLDIALKCLSLGKEPFESLSKAVFIPYVPQFIEAKITRGNTLLTFNHTCTCGIVERYVVSLGDDRQIKCPNCGKLHG